MIARLLFIALLAPAAAPPDLDMRAQALRAELASEQALPQGAKISLERQLLTSLERRRDLERAQKDAAALAQTPVAAPAAPPQTLLEIDDLRRDAQQLDLTIETGARRLEILGANRDAAAARLAEAVARRRQFDDSADRDSDRAVIARLETEFAESTTAELDLLHDVIDLQQQSARAQRDALSRRLAAAAAVGKPSAADVAEIERRLAARSDDLAKRFAAATAARESAYRELAAQAATASAEHVATLKEKLATRDIDIELAREAMSNLTIERAAWQLAIRYWRDADAGAIVEARERGPVIHATLERQLDFMKVSSDQILTRMSALDTEPLAEPALSEWRALRAALDERLRLLQAATLDARGALALLDRLRDDFDARIGVATWRERLSFAWTSTRSMLSRAWNFELFVVDQTVDVDGRQTSVPRSVTVAKLIQAPLLLLIGLFLAFRLTAFIERHARRRGVDEASARLTRRWTLGLLTCAIALSSLAIAGIPLAAFAFVGGAVAIGVGFGMQTLFKNLISGVMVLVERPFRLGDEIQLGDLRGIVVDVDLRASVVRDSEGSETLIPNSVLIEQNVKKMTSRSKTAGQTIDVVVDASSDPRKVVDTMRTAAERHGQLIASREPVVFLEDFGASGLRFSMQYWIEILPSGERRRIASDLRLMIFAAFQDAGIRFAQSQIDVRLDPRNVRDVVETQAA